MNKRGLLIIALLIFSIFLRPDVYIQEKTHTDSYYYGGEVQPASDTTIEIWFNEKQMVYSTPGRTVIVDRENNQMTIINRRSKTYVQTSLPLEMKNIVSAEILGMLQARKVSGEVKKTAETKKIESWNCTGYGVEVNQPYALEIKHWATTDVPFNWSLLNSMYSPIRQLGNYSNVYIDNLLQIGGFVVLSDTTVFLQGTSFKSETRVVGIFQKQPSPDTYSVPDGFKRNEQLSVQDLRNR
jgi:hypothetical protein